MRVVSTRVLPEPAPARTRSGPAPYSTAARWAGFSAGIRPAARAVLRKGDQILAVAQKPLADLSDFFRGIWSLGDAWVDVPLLVDREGDRFEVLDITMRSGSEYVGMRFKDMPVRGSLIGAIVRDGTAVFPRGDDVLRAGDRAIIFTESRRVPEVEKAL